MKCSRCRARDARQGATARRKRCNGRRLGRFRWDCNYPYPATQLAATGGSGIYTWSATGLPAGLSIGTSTGIISGTPLTNSGSPYAVQVNVTGSNSASAERSYTLAIGAVNPCDLKQTGSITVVDVQLIINEALGTTPVVYDLSGNGVANVVDVQIEIKAALGLGCAGQ